MINYRMVETPLNHKETGKFIGYRSYVVLCADPQHALEMLQGRVLITQVNGLLPTDLKSAVESKLKEHMEKHLKAGTESCKPWASPVTQVWGTAANPNDELLFIVPGASTYELSNSEDRNEGY